MHMSDESILAIVALLTLIATNLFALWKSSIAATQATTAAAAAQATSLQTHAAIMAVAQKTDVVHEAVKGLADAIATDK